MPEGTAAHIDDIFSVFLPAFTVMTENFSNLHVVTETAAIRVLVLPELSNSTARAQ